MIMSSLCYCRSEQGNWRVHGGKCICVVIYGMAEMIFSGFIYNPVQVISSLDVLNKRKRVMTIPPQRLFSQVLTLQNTQKSYIEVSDHW